MAHIDYTYCNKTQVLILFLCVMETALSFSHHASDMHSYEDNKNLAALHFLELKGNMTPVPIALAKDC
jgi:hypothetical protein